MSHEQPLNLKGPIDEARIQYFRPHELEEDECFGLEVFDEHCSRAEYIWRQVATFPTWNQARLYLAAEFPDALLSGLTDDLNSNDDDDDDDDGEAWDNPNFWEEWNNPNF